MQVITLGLGTTGDIAHLVLVGLSPSGVVTAIDLDVCTMTVTSLMPLSDVRALRPFREVSGLMPSRSARPLMLSRTVRAHCEGES